MKKIFSFFVAVLFAGSLMAAEELKATLDFTSNTAWNFPVGSDNGATASASFSNGTYSITLQASTKYYFNADGYLMLGKTNSTLTLPAFTWKTTKIVVTGRTGASGSTKQNIYVGTNAVSTETTGATAANQYAIAADYQAAGNVYVLKITSSHNSQITKIEIYGDSEGGQGGEGGEGGETSGCDWDNIEFLGNGSGVEANTNRFKICLPEGVGAVNIQNSFGTEAGIYVTFPSAAFGSISLEEGQYATQGAGMLLYISAFLYDAEKEVTVVCQDIEYKLTVRNANPETVPLTPKTCAEVYTMAANDEVLLNDVTVTYVNGANVYVKDAAGSMLIYLPKNTTVDWVAGDVISGLEGVVAIYKNLYEVKPTADQVAAVTVNHGDAPAPVELTAVPVAADMNKYVIIKGVECEAAFDSNKNMTATLGEATFILRNNFNANIAFDAEKTYTIVGVVAVYNNDVQVYFISAEVEVEPVVPADRRINAWGLNVVANGDDYVFSFYSNIAGNSARIIFYDGGQKVAWEDIDAPVAGLNEATIGKDRIPGGNITWAVELKANPVEEFGKVFDDTEHVLNRFHVGLDNSPESDYFGRVYGENRVADGEGYVYVFNPDYTLKEGHILAGMTKLQSAGRPWVDEDGTVLLADYGDDHGGIYVMNPSTLTATSFFDGVQDVLKTNGVPNGIWRNGTVELGSSCVAVAVHGTGADKVLIAANEDQGEQLTKNGLTLYNIGQADGSILRTWNAAPSAVLPLQNNGGGNFAFAPSSHGVFVAQNRSIPASGTNNNSTAYSVMMYDYQGNKLFVSDADHMPNLTANPGGGIALSADESQLAIIDQASNIRMYNIAWEGNTPSVTLAATYPCGFAAAGTLSFDYAGNLVGSMGTAYGTSMRLVVYGVPTEHNEIVVPAKKSLTVSGTATAISEIFDAVKVEKVIRNGQVLIIKDGKTYNMMGQIVK